MEQTRLGRLRRMGVSVTHVILQQCCNDAACVAVCPVDCIHPRPDEPGYGTTEMLYIDPDTCIDCGACTEACPVDAISSDYDLRPSQQPFSELNAAFYKHQPHPCATASTRPSDHRDAATANTLELHVAVIGSGPAGCYATAELLSGRDLAVRVDMFERLTTPWGLVRFGVAPDHPATKSVTVGFQRIIDDPRVRLWLNVEVGRDITPEQLSKRYHAVIYAVGAMDARAMDIPGEDLPGSHSASEFVAWYNGHPDYAEREFDLAAERAVVIGNGNVAIDIARMLLSTPESLYRTDIAQHAVQALSASRIREVVIVGRRGPAQAAFTNGELLGLLGVPGIDVVVEPSGFDTTQRSGGDLDFSASQKVARLSELFGSTSVSDRRIVLRFCVSPERLLGDDQVNGIRIRHNALVADDEGVRAVPTDEFEDIPCGMVIRSVGYQGQPLASLPFDLARAVIPNRDGRVVDGLARLVSGVYVTGWIKRGPSGVIGTNKQCAMQTVGVLVEDFLAGRLTEPTADLSDVHSLIPGAFDVRAWNAIDQHERDEGTRTGRPRVKIVDGRSLLALAHKSVTVPVTGS